MLKEYFESKAEETSQNRSNQGSQVSSLTPFFQALKMGDKGGKSTRLVSFEETLGKNRSEAIIRDVQMAYWNWVFAVTHANGDPKTVVDLYQVDAVLLPTLSPEVMINCDGGLDEYFENFTGLTELKCFTDELVTQISSVNRAMNSGRYRFTYASPNGQHELAARFNFVYEKVGERWLILNHHSSIQPEPSQNTRPKLN